MAFASDPHRDRALGYPSDRRLTISLSDYWESLRGDTVYPLLSDIDMKVINDVRADCFLLEFRDGDEHPVFRFVGRGLTDECGQDLTQKTVLDVPRGTLLTQLTDLFLNVLNNEGPVGAQGEFTDRGGQMRLYRGIMVPFSENGGRIDFILGAISAKAKEKSSETTLPPIDVQVPPPPPETASDADPALEGDSETDSSEAAQELPAGGSELEYVLAECRQMAGRLEHAELRTRDALYEVLAGVYGFYFETESDPEGYEDLLEEAGLKRQQRSPLTPLLKLVFGGTFDKTRISEYATALSHAERCGRSPDDIKTFFHDFSGGIKGCVRAERAERRAARGQRDARLEAAVELLRAAPALTEMAAPDAGGPDTDQDEFVLMLARRKADAPDRLEVVHLLDETPVRIEPLLKRAARTIAKARRRR